MKKLYSVVLLCFLSAHTIWAQADPNEYLHDIKTALKKEWPKNRTINIVFHGHSVPAGYFKTPVVNTFDAYPFLFLKALKERYPNAVVNVIVTAIGGENALSGEKRFAADVLSHKPDLIFIDYALNDKAIGLDKAMVSWKKMIEAALKENIKVLLMTPTPHQAYNLADTANLYEPYTRAIIQLANTYHIGLVNSYEAFRKKLNEGHHVEEYMSQINHPNKEGHQVVADEIIKWFEK